MTPLTLRYFLGGGDPGAYDVVDVVGGAVVDEYVGANGAVAVAVAADVGRDPYDVDCCFRAPGGVNHDDEVDPEPPVLLFFLLKIPIFRLCFMSILVVLL